MKKIVNFKYYNKVLLVLMSLIILGSFIPTIISDSGEKNLYVQQANAFLQGRLDIDQHYHDVAIYKGRYYVPFPPFPALLLLPFVAMLGVNLTKVMFVSIILSVLSVIILMHILRKLNIDPKYIPWIVVSFILGTAYWSTALRSSSVWFFAHIVAVTFILLAINEVFGKGRGMLAGLFLGFAFLSRQLYIYSVFFLLFMLWDKSTTDSLKLKIRKVLGFLLSLSFCISLYLVFNWIRFDNAFDTGYSYLSLPEIFRNRVEKYGLFNPAYIPFNFIYMFLQGFHVEFSPPTYLSGITMDPFGTSITFASPFVFIALLAKWKKKLLWAAWVSIGLTLLHMLLYYTNGYVQANSQRFTLDFFPIIILLVALGLHRIPESIWKGAIIYSVLLNFIALVFVFLEKTGF